MYKEVNLNGVTLANFIKFVMTQPSDRLLNHRSFSSCAIGEFIDDIGIGAEHGQMYKYAGKLAQDEAMLLYGTVDDYFNKMLANSEPNLYSLISMLNEAGMDNRYCPQNYGDLQRWVRDKPHLAHLIPV